MKIKFKLELALLTGVALAVSSITLWQVLSEGQAFTEEPFQVSQSSPDPNFDGAPLSLTGTIEYTVRDANGDVKEHGTIYNTVNDPEAINEVFNRIVATASGGAYDGITALSVAVATDDPSDGVDASSITLNLDGDSGTSGNQNPADGTVATDFGTESGNGTVVVTFTAQANNLDIKQIVLTKAAEDDTATDGAAAIADADIFAYLDVADIILNTNDTVQYTWTVDVD